MEQHPGWRFGSPRPRSLGFQEIDTMQSNVVWYEAERVVCLYHADQRTLNPNTPLGNPAGILLALCNTECLCINP